MIEQQFKLSVIAALEARGYRCQQHEDRHCNFIADVSFSGNYVDGWVEVKFCHTAPGSLGKIKHWTKGQEKWLLERHRAGSGHCYLLVGIEDTNQYFMWRADDLARARSLSLKAALPSARIRAVGMANFQLAFDRAVRVRG